MKEIEIIQEHELIRDTVGYDVISKIETVDIPIVLSFLQIVVNYIKMARL